MLKQCASPQTPKNSRDRCEHSTYGESKHCKQHHTKALKLYLNYKALCDYADKLNIHKPVKNRSKKIAHLKNCHQRLVDAYNARMKHRNYAFFPDCWDYGHNLQFTIINNKIETCQREIKNLIASRFTSMRSEDHVYVDDDDNDNDDTNDDTNGDPNSDTNSDTIEYKNLVSSIRSFNKLKKRDEIETNLMLEKYISINKKRVEKENKAIVIFAKILKNISKTDDVVMNESLFRLIGFMDYSVEYFDEDYIPKICSNCDCKQYQSYDFLLDTNKLGDKDSLESLFTGTRVEFIDYMVDTTLSNLSKIIPICGDLKGLYKIYGRSILNMGISIQWDRKTKRLIVSEGEDNHKREKVSKYLSFHRKSDKLKNEILKEEEINHDLHDLDREFPPEDNSYQSGDLDDFLNSDEESEHNDSD